MIATESRANTEIRECKNKVTFKKLKSSITVDDRLLYTQVHFFLQEKQFYSAMQLAKEEDTKLRRDIESLKREINEKNTKINELQMCENDEVKPLNMIQERVNSNK